MTDKISYSVLQSIARTNQTFKFVLSLRYVVGVSNIRDHVSRLNNPSEQENLSVDSMKLSFDKELNLNLYR